jgi:hypothetical protein
LTDVNPTTLENLRYNVSLNAEAAASSDTMQVSTVSNHPTIMLIRQSAYHHHFAGKQIDWSNRDSWPAEPAHVLIGADLVYSTDILPLLTAAVAGLLAPGLNNMPVFLWCFHRSHHLTRSTRSLPFCRRQVLLHCSRHRT